MLDNYKIITLTHRRIDLRHIKDYVVQTAEGQSVDGRLLEIKHQFGLQELMYVATCNRVMYLFYVEDLHLDEVFADRFMQAVNPRLSNKQLDKLTEVAYLLEGTEAIEHLLEVSASIDSLVIGERQILGQIREAFQASLEAGLSGDSIRLLVQHAIRAAKKVYSHTRIGAKPVSIVSLGIHRMLRSHLPPKPRILLVGAGATNQLVAKFLEKNHFQHITVFNRTLEKARQLAASFKGQAHSLEELDSYDKGFDCMIVCTGAVEPIITQARYQRLLAGETTPKVILDLAIPHNVAEEVVATNEVHYIEVEGLRHLAKENLAFREREVTQARELLDEFLIEFPLLFKQRQLEIAMRQVPEAIKAIRSHAVNEVFRKEVEELDDHSRQLVERMLAYMEKKCIGIPMKAAREAIIR